MNRAVQILAALCVLLGLALAVRTFMHQPPAVLAPIVQPTTTEPSTTASPTSDGDLVLDLFNPSTDSLNHQLNETALKARLEDTITLSFLLRRCEYLNQQIYDETYRALAIYAKLTSPGMNEAQIQATITSAIEAAKARYGLIYSRLECNLPQLATANVQLAQWRASMLNPPQ